jgi:hypothetical protein
MNENFKRNRGDKTSSLSQPISNDIGQKNFNSYNPLNKNLSSAFIPKLQQTNITQSIIKNSYNENRLKSMSHIKQINPKYRNYIIPVLPGAFNKFSNI